MTGANGFIGKKVLHAFTQQPNLKTIAVVRDQAHTCDTPNVQWLVVKDYLSFSDWQKQLETVDVVVHMAGIIQPPNVDNGEDPLSAMMKVNRDISGQLATDSVAAGVKRFVYLSSLSLYGDKNNDRFLTLESPLAVSEPYAESKYAGEIAIEAAIKDQPIEWLHIRPPMVVGEGTKGTFYSMANLCSKLGYSPFGGIKKHYPIVLIPTLIEFIVAAIEADTTEDGVYLVGEKKKYTVANIISEIAALSGKRVRHVAVPKPLLTLLMTLLGKSKSFKQISGGLELDVDKAHRLIEKVKGPNQQSE